MGLHQKTELQWQKNGWRWRLLRDHTGWADATVDARVSQALEFHQPSDHRISDRFTSQFDPLEFHITLLSMTSQARDALATHRSTASL